MTRRTVWQRDVDLVRRAAVELIEQCDHFERNTAKGHDDTIRGLVMEPHAVALVSVTGRMRRRWERLRARVGEESGR